MPNYLYTAKSFDGQTKTGTLFAKDIHQLAQSLKGENVFLIEALPTEENKKKGLGFKLPSFGIKAKEKIMLVRNLWIMFGAGLSLVKIFDLLSRQSKNPKLKTVMLDVMARLNKGETFSDALAKHREIFDDFFLSMVKIGEEAGTLEDVFEILSIHLDRDHELRSKIKGALIYPCIVLIVMGLIGIVICIFVLPTFSSFLLGMNIPLPIYTRILIWLGAFSQKYWYLVIFTPFVLAYLYFMAVRTKKGKWLQDTAAIKIPLLAPFIKKSNAAVIIRSLSSLNSSGISLVRSLEITSATAGNIYFKNALNAAAEKVKKGEKLSSTLRPYSNLFPSGTMDMMEVGEETGKTSLVLKKLAEFYEGEVIELTKNFSTIIEPLLIVFLGLVVAFFAISVIAPMYASFNSI